MQPMDCGERFDHAQLNLSGHAIADILLRDLEKLLLWNSSFSITYEPLWKHGIS
ncbi:hypothetical protein [Paenibacillus mendelii]|uniref:Uncharacterized protein n=1 Tax=Paenibacillus mendelii TaxID=206163 RepID=A0ABV6J2A4_9BACL|nr:hypothetical protein [Paenibacillus mendelii]MCQ6560514.1 hypothetical protein [Paenibacillus mendelii]